MLENNNMNTIIEWYPYPKNKYWRKNAEKAKNVPNPEPNDDKKGWGVKTNKKKDGDWYMNEEENWQDAYSDGKKITQSRRVNGSKQYRTVDAPKKQSKFKPTKYTGSPKDGSWYKNESVVSKTLIRLTESDLHRIVKESVQRILREHDLYALGRGSAHALERSADLAREMGQSGEFDDEKIAKMHNQDRLAHNANRLQNRLIGLDPDQEFGRLNDPDFGTGFNDFQSEYRAKR